MQSLSKIYNIESKNYSVSITKDFLESKGLSVEALGLYVFLSSLNDTDKLSDEKLADLVGVGVTKIKRILEELQNKGVLVKHFYNDELGYKRTDFVLPYLKKEFFGENGETNTNYITTNEKGE